MATNSVLDVGFVSVAGELEPGAIAGTIALDAHTRVAGAVTLTIDSLEEDEHPLNQLQRTELLESVLRCMDGFERATLDELVRVFSQIETRDDAS